MELNGGWCYANSLIAAAQKIADRAHQNVNGSADIIDICRDYGIFIDQMGDNEIKEFLNIVDSYL